jgi:hypothetical protein
MKCAAPLGGGNDLSKFSPNIGWSQGSNWSFRCMGQSKTPSASPRHWPLEISCLDQLLTGFSSDARSAEDSEAQMPFACNHVVGFPGKPPSYVHTSRALGPRAAHISKLACHQ